MFYSIFLKSMNQINQSCVIQRKLPHKPMDLATWNAYVKSEENNSFPIKTMLLAIKGALPMLFSLSSDKSADLKTLASQLGVKKDAVRVASKEVIHRIFGADAPHPLSALCIDALPSFPGESPVSIALDNEILQLPDDSLLACLDVEGSGSVFLTKREFLQCVTRNLSGEVLNVKLEGLPDGISSNVGKNAVAEKKGHIEAGISRLGLEVRKETNFVEWYSQILTRSELIEYYDISGCYILRPWAYEIWENVKSWFDRRIKAIGVKNCYFPMFVSKSGLEREMGHIEGFAAEVAWVTKSGNSDLSEPIAIRPTSETVMYPSYAKWIRSHRDLPLRLNQWCNVVRWEFSHPTPFIRTREFLWQEGHTAWESQEQAGAEVTEILGLYRRVYEELLAVPVIPGTKTEKEKFAGGLYTTTVEAFVPSTGRGCQAATSHCLGQNFAKMFGIEFEDDKKQKRLVWQNSWGLTTRSLGLLIMVHGDDKGLVLPPRVAPYQVVIIPCGITASMDADLRQRLLSSVNKLARELGDQDVRVHADTRVHYSPGWKYNYWELKGVPLRIEFGPKELDGQTYTVCLRHDGIKTTVRKNYLVSDINVVLERIQKEMFERAQAVRKERIMRVSNWVEFVSVLNKKCCLLSPWCGREVCEDNIKKVSAEESKQLLQADEEDTRAPSMGAKALCIPFDQTHNVSDQKCIFPGCNEIAKFEVLFGRSY